MYFFCKLFMKILLLYNFTEILALSICISFSVSKYCRTSEFVKIRQSTILRTIQYLFREHSRKKMNFIKQIITITQTIKVFQGVLKQIPKIKSFKGSQHRFIQNRSWTKLQLSNSTNVLYAMHGTYLFSQFINDGIWHKQKNSGKLDL